jgi:hypothetical protein
MGRAHFDQLERLAPDTWTLDWDRLGRAGNAEIQIDLFGDYQRNVELFPFCFAGFP